MFPTAAKATKTVVAVLLAVIAAAGVGRLLRADAAKVPSNTWAATGDMSPPRAAAASSLLYDGDVLPSEADWVRRVSFRRPRATPQSPRCGTRSRRCTSHGRGTQRRRFMTVE